MFTNHLSGIKVSKYQIGLQFYRALRISNARTKETRKTDDFLQSWKRWSVSCYTDRLLSNQTAGKLVPIRCHLIITVNNVNFGLIYEFLRNLWLLKAVATALLGISKF